MKAMRGTYQNGAVRFDEDPGVTGPVEVIVTFLEVKPGRKPKPRGVRKSIRESPAVGMWADRTDIGDTAEFCRGLRERAERREDGRGSD
jgi:hypothetical protein